MNKRRILWLIAGLYLYIALSGFIIYGIANRLNKERTDDYMNGYFFGLVGFVIFILQDRQEVCERNSDRKNP